MMTWWSPAHVFPSSEDYCKQQYYQLIDTALRAIQVRFESDTWRFLSTVEVALTPGYSATLTKTTSTQSGYTADSNASRLRWIETADNKQLWWYCWPTPNRFSNSLAVTRADEMHSNTALNSSDVMYCWEILLSFEISQNVHATMTHIRLNRC